MARNTGRGSTRAGRLTQRTWADRVRHNSALDRRVAWCVARGNYWLGVGNWVVGIRDHREIRPLFSERYARRPSAHYLHIGPWCFSLDTNWRGSRRNWPT